jgi:2-polyprenyl-6-methoxyphenol hydroxylase-like FAD-dependent oxidoreductase
MRDLPAQVDVRTVDVRTVDERVVDVAVVGGGPAGLAAALRLARRGISVAVCERATSPRPRAGETVPPQIRLALEELGAWERFAAAGHLPGWATSSSWGGGGVGYSDFLFRPGGPGWHLDRARFEADLEAEAAARGAVVLRGVGVEPEAGPAGGWRLAVRWATGEVGRLYARIAVDASGRRSALARRQGRRRLALDALVGAYAFFRRPPDSRVETGVTLVEAVERGWWYTAALPDEKLVACFFTDADLLRGLELGDEVAWRVEAARARHTAPRLAGAEPLGAPRVLPAASALLDQPAGEGWLAVGDAAASFDPLSSRGILTALTAGIGAADAICGALAGDREALPRYAAGVRLDFARYLDGWGRFYGIERRWPAATFWRRRQGRVTLAQRNWHPPQADRRSSSGSVARPGRRTS